MQALISSSTWCYLRGVVSRGGKSQRVFKTAWFAKASAKALIPDAELCAAIHQVMLGQCDDLGGGVYKKRLRKNLFRSIILAKAGQYWVYQFLFAKQDRSNIDRDELLEFRRIAKSYDAISEQRIAELIANRQWMEICNEDKS
jgi:hypothetical protein